MNQAMQETTRTGTLSIRPGLSRDGKPARKPFVAKGHDAILKDFQDSGHPVEIYLISSEVPLVGRIAARDKFTITVVIPETNKKRTIYKHAIESFGAL